MLALSSVTVAGTAAVIAVHVTHHKSFMCFALGI